MKYWDSPDADHEGTVKKGTVCETEFGVAIKMVFTDMERYPQYIKLKLYTLYNSISVKKIKPCVCVYRESFWKIQIKILLVIFL